MIPESRSGVVITLSPYQASSPGWGSSSDLARTHRWWARKEEPTKPNSAAGVGLGTNPYLGMADSKSSLNSRSILKTTFFRIKLSKKSCEFPQFSLFMGLRSPKWGLETFGEKSFKTKGSINNFS